MTVDSVIASAAAGAAAAGAAGAAAAAIAASFVLIRSLNISTHCS